MRPGECVARVAGELLEEGPLGPPVALAERMDRVDLAQVIGLPCHERFPVQVTKGNSLRLPVPGNGLAVQFRSADSPVHTGRDLLVMIRGERPRQLDLDGLGCGERGVQACALPGDRLVPLVHLIRQEDSLWLAVRTEGDRRRRRALTAEAREYARKPLPDLRQRMHLDHSRISQVTSVLKLCTTFAPLGVRDL